MMHVEELPGVFRLSLPGGASVPIVFESPHSGRDYPADFETVLPLARLRQAEDAYVGELLATAPDHGIAVIEALFPRSYIDPDGDLNDVDPELLAAPWPTSSRHAGKPGPGLVRRVVTPDVAIYDRKLDVAEVERRIACYWRPYRERVDALVHGLARRHGRLLVVRWHSTPGDIRGDVNDTASDATATQADVMVGTGGGPAALALDRLAALFGEHGLNVALDPVGAAVARIPGVAVVRVELDQALYLEPDRVERTAGFARLRTAADEIAAGLAQDAASLFEA